jgi:acyl-CoA thioester hydrolase
MKSIREEVRVRWSETDAVGIAHFTSFFIYFEAAEQKLFREVLKIDFSNLREPRKIFGLTRVEAYCQYFAPARFDDLLEVELKIGKIGNSSITYEFSVFNKTLNKMSASGRVKVVAIDKDFKPMEIPLDIGELLN